MPSRKSIDREVGFSGEEDEARLQVGAWALGQRCGLCTDGSYRNVFCVPYTDHLNFDNYLAFSTSSGGHSKCPVLCTLEILIKLGAQSFRNVIKMCIADLD